MDVLMKHQ